ncbi:MAG: nuclear transport factor 2 family protein [Marmoricola sp.]
MTHDDIAEIKQLKYRYLRTPDLKLWDEYAECFLPEVTGDYAGLVFENRDDLVTYMRENLGEGAAFYTDRYVRTPD